MELLRIYGNTKHVQGGPKVLIKLNNCIINGRIKDYVKYNRQDLELLK